MPLRGCNCGGDKVKRSLNETALFVCQRRRVLQDARDVLVQGFLLWLFGHDKTPRPGGVRGVGMKAGQRLKRRWYCSSAVGICAAEEDF